LVAAFAFFATALEPFHDSISTFGIHDRRRDLTIGTVMTNPRTIPSVRRQQPHALTFDVV